jgi:hypothetical protein
MARHCPTPERFPKLDVTGSIPVARSILGFCCEYGLERWVLGLGTGLGTVFGRLALWHHCGGFAAAGGFWGGLERLTTWFPSPRGCFWLRLPCRVIGFARRFEAPPLGIHAWAATRSLLSCALTRRRIEIIGRLAIGFARQDGWARVAPEPSARAGCGLTSALGFAPAFCLTLIRKSLGLWTLC